MSNLFHVRCDSNGWFVGGCCWRVAVPAVGGPPPLQHEENHRNKQSPRMQAIREHQHASVPFGPDRFKGVFPKTRFPQHSWKKVFL